MKNVRKNLIAYSVPAGVLTLVGMILRSASLIMCYDRDIGYYVRSAFLPDAFHAVCVIAALLALSAFFLLPKGDIYERKLNTTLASRLGAVFALCGTAVYMMLSLIGKTGDSIIYSSSASGTGSFIEALSVIFAFLAIIYFAVVIAGKGDKGEAPVYFGYGVILFVLMVLAKTYFDFFTTMNSPNKLLLQISFMSIMLYMLFELRFGIEKAMPKGYIASALAAVFFTFVTSVPGIIMYFLGIFTRKDYLACHFAVLGFCVYIVVRFASYAMALSKTEK